MFRAITSNFQWAGVYCMEWRQYRPTKFILRTFPRTFRSLFLRFFLVVIHCRKYIPVISFGKHSDCLWQLRCLKTWSLKIKPSVWFLRVVPLTNLRSNIHFELFLFTLIPACLAVGISGPVLQRIERVLSFGPWSWENIRIKSLLAKLRRRKSTPGPPTSDVGYNNTAAVKNSPKWKRGGGGEGGRGCCSPLETLYVCASQRVWCLRHFGLEFVVKDFSSLLSTAVWDRVWFSRLDG